MPAGVRRRWGTSAVYIEDHGDHLLLRPAPDDPIAAARGALRDALPVNADELRAAARAEEQAAEERTARDS